MFAYFYSLYHYGIPGPHGLAGPNVPNKTGMCELTR